MSRWLIDDFGNIKPASVENLAEIIGLPSAPPESDSERLEDAAVRNIGLIVVKHTGGAINIRCRPAVMAERAFGTLGYWLWEHPGLPVTIDWYDQSWKAEWARDARTAVSFLSYMLELKRPLTVTPTERIRSQPSVQAARHWQQVRARVAALPVGELDPKVCTRVLDPIFMGRWMVAEIAPPGEDVCIVARGAGYPLLDQFFSARTPHRTLEELPDPKYRAWVVSSFIDVVNSGRPRFDDVDAIVDWPRFGYLRTRYWRMLVPLTRSSDRCRILSASGNDSGIDLRPKHIEEMS
jgi:hypothetical protein